MQIQNKGAIVVGGASGLGAATVHALVEKGAMVVILDRDSVGCESLVSMLGAKVSYQLTDISDAKSLEKAVSGAESQLPSLDIGVNCAGVASAMKTFSQSRGLHDFDLFQKTLAVNLAGAFNFCRLCVPMMISKRAEDENGVLINTASIAAFEGQMGQVAYSASKGGIVSMTLPLARDLAQYRIRVNTIAPGVFDTPMMSGFGDDVIQPLVQNVLHPKRLGQPLEFAKLVCHIIENAYLNAQVLRLDGGIRMPA